MDLQNDMDISEFLAYVEGEALSNESINNKQHSNINTFKCKEEPASDLFDPSFNLVNDSLAEIKQECNNIFESKEEPMDKEFDSSNSLSETNDSYSIELDYKEELMSNLDLHCDKINDSLATDKSHQHTNKFDTVENKVLESIHRCSSSIRLKDFLHLDNINEIEIKEEPFIDPNVAESIGIFSSVHSSNNNIDISKIEQCVAKWKETFPWIIWELIDNNIYCNICKSLFQDESQKLMKPIIGINKDKLFKVSKELHKHSNNDLHMIAVLLGNESDMLRVIDFISNNALPVYSSRYCDEINEIIFRQLNITIVKFRATVKLLELYLIDQLVENIKKKYFSIICCPCRGILIIRYIKKNKVLHHVLPVYNKYSLTMTPFQFLVQVGINTKSVIHVALINCESECPKCSMMVNDIPQNVVNKFGLPSSDLVKVVNSLWKYTVLRYIISFCISLVFCKKTYPYIFMNDGINVIELEQVYQRPCVLYKVLSHIDLIRTRAKSLFNVEGCIMACGVGSFEFEEYSILFPILDVIPAILKVSKGFVDTLETTIILVMQNLEKLYSLVPNAKVTQIHIDQLKSVYNIILETLRNCNSNQLSTLNYATILLRANPCEFIDEDVLGKNFNDTYDLIYNIVKEDYGVMKALLRNFILSEGSLVKLTSKEGCLLEYFDNNLVKYGSVLKFYYLVNILPFSPCDRFVSFSNLCVLRSLLKSICPTNSIFNDMQLIDSLILIKDFTTTQNKIELIHIKQWWKKKYFCENQ